jgi:GTPase SAR1 family protein
LNILHQELKPSLALHILQTGFATHIVAGISWGAKTVVIAKHRLASNENRMEVEGMFQHEFSQFKSVIKTSGDANIGHESTSVDKDMSFEVSVHGDVLANDGLLPTDFPSAYKFISNMPKYLAAANGGKGKPLAYKLLPIDILASSMNVNIKADVTFLKQTIDGLERFVQFFDSLKEAQEQLTDYFGEINRHKFCVPREHRVIAAKTLKSSMLAEAAAKSRYASILKDVRYGRADAEQLWTLLEDLNKGERSPEQLLAITNEYRSKMAFADLFISKGAKYIGYEGTSLDGQLIANDEDDAYVFFFNRETMKDKATWEGNRRLLMALLNEPNKRKLIIIVNCDATKEELEFSCIKHYREGNVIADNLLDQERGLAGLCFARYDEKLLDVSGVGKPLNRTLVKTPCPGNYCTPNRQKFQWVCYKCHVQLEYGYDKFLYCDCGRCPYDAFEFKCKEAKHGSKFWSYDACRLLKRLEALEPFDELNILILGETGVGKSTFINAFINYLKFDSLGAAMSSNKFHWAIPCSFSMLHVDKHDPYEKFIQTDVSVGHSDEEHSGTTGNSATQTTSIYPVKLGETLVRLIDTPGIGDTRGVEKDKENMADILAKLKYFPKLHGILILLKPNDSRLTVMFRFCVKELLTHLHRDAARNMVFGFTNTRISNYTPGDTFKPLERLLQEHSDVGLTLSRHTVYCFDSESFRFLAADKQGTRMDNEEDFRRSWQHSEGEARRLVQHFQSMPPHLVKSTLSLNRTRELIHQLTIPMANISRTIETTIRINEDNVELLSQFELKGEDLRSRVDFQKLVLVAVELDKPRTVCSDSSCLEYRDDGYGEKKTIYKSHCHSSCYLRTVPQKVVGAPELARCTAFSGGNQYCTKSSCKHHWMKHLHVTYELKEETAVVKDKAIEEELAKNASDIEVQNKAIDSLKRQIEEARDEHAKIQLAAAKFGVFLKQNSITPYNDAMLDYIDHQTNQERDKLTLYPDQNRARLNGLIKRRQEYEAKISSIKMSIESGDTTSVLDEEGVEKLIQSLYDLKHWGQNLQDVQSGVARAEEAAYRERPYAVTTITKHKSGWLKNPKRWASKVGGYVLPGSYI